MGSLSEGQKHKDSSSGSELGDIDIDDDDEEERIIEMRRKKREELMKVNFKEQIFSKYQIIDQWQVKHFLYIKNIFSFRNYRIQRKAAARNK